MDRKKIRCEIPLSHSENPSVISVEKDSSDGKVWFKVQTATGGTEQKPYGFIPLKDLKKFARAILKL